MSYDLCFWYDAASPTTEQAAEIYERLVDGETGVIASTQAVDDFFSEVIDRYGDLTEENVDAPWTSALYRTNECVIATVAYSRRKDVCEVLLSIANSHKLTVFDPQNGKVYRPDGR